MIAMPMVYCSKCGKLVSTRAENCCRCGEPLADSAELRRYELMRLRKEKLSDIYVVSTLLLINLIMIVVFSSG